MSGERERGPIIDDAELEEHRITREAWSRRAGLTLGRSDDARATGVVALLSAYAYAIDGYRDVRARFPGRCTAASNAIRSLEASIRGLWFELEGDDTPRTAE